MLRRTLGLAAVFAGFALFFTRPARLFDADSYLHLALARDLTTALADRLAWTRFSTLGQSYGDKELLFHLLLAPFAKLADPELGGKLALALSCTALAWTLWRLGSQALGARGWIVPVLVFGSGSFLLRALRLRPELLALLLLLWVVWALAERRYRLAAGLALAFTLSHTAFHTLLGLSVAFLCWQRWTESRWEWQLVAAVALGVAGGILLHPQFPRNLEVFWVQNVEFFRLRRELAVGEEFQPHSSWDLATLDGLCWLGLLVLFGARERGAPGDRARRFASFCWIAAAAFGALFVQMGRFATLFVPFLVLAASFELRARGFEVGTRLRLPGGRSGSSRLALAVVAALSGTLAVATAFVNWQLSGAFDPGLRRELDRIAALLPDGARVAASWNDAELYAFHAPHARYLNLYDPVFMRVGDPKRHAVWTAVLAGELPDVPGAVTSMLESEYLAFGVAGSDALLQRLAADPRSEVLHRGQHVLVRFAGRHGRFVTDWRVKDAPPAEGGDAYVDATRGLASDGCAVLERIEPASEGAPRLFELAAWGPSVVFVDGRQRVQIAAPGRAKLGQGVLLPLARSEVRWTVRTCAHEGHAGFYWLER